MTSWYLNVDVRSWDALRYMQFFLLGDLKVDVRNRNENPTSIYWLNSTLSTAYNMYLP